MLVGKIGGNRHLTLKKLDQKNINIEAAKEGQRTKRRWTAVDL